MKVIQINSVCNNSSTGRLVTDLSIMMGKNGIDNKIIFGIKHSTYPHAVKIGNLLDVKLHILKSRLLGKHSFYSKRITAKIINYIDAEKPDIVHLHQMHGGYINIKLLFEYLANKRMKVVWTIHDCWPLTGHCAHFDAVHCNKWVDGCNFCPQYRLYPKSYFFDRSRENYQNKLELYKNVDITVVTPSKWLYNIAKKSILKEKEIFCIYNWIDANYFYPKERMRLKESLNICDKFVIMSIYKYDKTWINKYNEIADKLDNDECLLVVGVDNHIKDLFSKKIITVPFLDMKMLTNIYAISDVYILASIQESFGLTIAEAMACGVPVIGCNRTAIPEVIGSDNCGKILNDYDSDTIVNAVKIIRSCKKYNYKKNCINRAKEYFNKDKNTLSYIQLYNKLSPTSQIK